MVNLAGKGCAELILIEILTMTYFTRLAVKPACSTDYCILRSWIKIVLKVQRRGYEFGIISAISSSKQLGLFLRSTFPARFTHMGYQKPALSNAQANRIRNFPRNRKFKK
jgi:hypothetical protein